jgi:hypothetical protein
VLGAQLKPQAKGVQSILEACDMNILLWVLQLLLAAVYLALVTFVASCDGGSRRSDRELVPAQPDW